MSRNPVFFEIPAYMNLSLHAEHTTTRGDGKEFKWRHVTVTCPKGWKIGDIDVSGATFLIFDNQLKKNPHNANHLIALPDDAVVRLRVPVRGDDGAVLKDESGKRLYEEVPVAPADLRAAWKAEREEWKASHPMGQEAPEEGREAEERDDPEPMPLTGTYDHDIEF